MRIQNRTVLLATVFINFYPNGDVLFFIPTFPFSFARFHAYYLTVTNLLHSVHVKNPIVLFLFVDILLYITLYLLSPGTEQISTKLFRAAFLCWIIAVFTSHWTGRTTSHQLQDPSAHSSHASPHFAEVLLTRVILVHFCRIDDRFLHDKHGRFNGTEISHFTGYIDDGF